MLFDVDYDDDGVIALHNCGSDSKKKGIKSKGIMNKMWSTCTVDVPKTGIF